MLDAGAFITFFASYDVATIEAALMSEAAAPMPPPPPRYFRCRHARHAVTPRDESRCRRAVSAMPPCRRYSDTLLMNAA